MIPKELVDHPVGRLSGVRETDTRIQAAEKAVAAMRAAGFPKREITRAKRMIADAKRRGVK